FSTSMKTVYMLILCSLIYATQALAQMPVVAGFGPSIDVGVGYSYVNLARPSSSRIGLLGPDASLTFDLFRRFSVRAELGYVRTVNVFGSQNNSDLLTYLGGPVFYPVRRRHFAAYAQAL